MSIELELEISPDGHISAPWWSEEIAKIICGVCGRNGWTRFGPFSSEELAASPQQGKARWGECFRCATRQPYCG